MRLPAAITPTRLAWGALACFLFSLPLPAVADGPLSGGEAAWMSVMYVLTTLAGASNGGVSTDAPIAVACVAGCLNPIFAIVPIALARSRGNLARRGWIAALAGAVVGTSAAFLGLLLLAPMRPQLGYGVWLLAHVLLLAALTRARSPATRASGH